jgi:hypothetical protein
MVSDASQGVIAICITEHTSSPAPASIRDDVAFWTFIVDMTGADAVSADMVAYDDSTGHSGAIDVDQALDWVISVSYTSQQDLAILVPMVADHETRIGILESEMDVAQAQLIDHDTRISSNTAAIAGQSSTIAGIVASDASQEGRLTVLETASATHLTDAPSDGNQYARKNGAWDVVAASAGGAAILISDTPPVGAPDNTLWWESDTGVMYVLYNDGTSTQWVVAVNVPDIASFATKAYVDAQDTAITAKKNYIINGGMQVSQQNPLTSGTTSDFYPVDQFFLSFSNAGTQGIAQVAVPTPGGSPNRIRLACSAADVAIAASDYCMIQHRIEGTRVADLRFGSADAKAVTLRFGCKGPAGVYCVSLRNHTPDRTYVQEFTIAPGEANIDVVKTLTFPGDIAGTWQVTQNTGLIVTWGFMAGTTYHTTAGAWNAAGAFATVNQFNFMGLNTNVFELFDIALYQGSYTAATLPPYILGKFEDEMAASQRYYFKMYWGAEYWCQSANIRMTYSMSLPTTMRAAPTRTRITTGSAVNVRGSDPATYVTANAASQDSVICSIEGAAAAFTQCIGYVESYSARL